MKVSRHAAQLCFDNSYLIQPERTIIINAEDQKSR